MITGHVRSRLICHSAICQVQRGAGIRGSEVGPPGFVSNRVSRIMVRRAHDMKRKASA